MYDEPESSEKRSLLRSFLNPMRHRRDDEHSRPSRPFLPLLSDILISTASVSSTSSTSSTASVSSFDDSFRPFGDSFRITTSEKPHPALPLDRVSLPSDPSPPSPRPLSSKKILPH